MCPNENEFLARVAGSLTKERVAALDEHVDVCSACRMVLAEVAMGPADLASEPATAATFSARELVADRYVIVRLIATGGMGEVYEVHDKWVDERVALKTIVAAIADDARALSRLRAEVRLARRVTHQNVCRVYDLGFHGRGDEQIAFLTMELLTGVTLRAHLAATGPLAPAEALPLIRQMGEALRHAHAAGIVHRDFKSDNVMLVSGKAEGLPRVVVTDFGLARQSLVGTHQPLTPQSRTVFGTVDYMSPEQVLGRTATVASDVYSFGIVLFELLTGRLPFEGESPLARALLRVTEEAPSLQKALPEAPRTLTASVAGCLRTKPEARFGTIDDVLECIGGDRPLAPRRRTPSRRVLLAAGLATGLAVGCFLSFAFSRSGGETNTLAPLHAPEHVRVNAAVAAPLIAPAITESPIASSSLPANVGAPVAATPITGASRSSAAPPRRPQLVAPAATGARSGASLPPAASGEPRPESGPAQKPAADEGAVTPVTHRDGKGDALLNPFRPRGPAPVGSQAPNVAPVPSQSGTARAP